MTLDLTATIVGLLAGLGATTSPGVALRRWGWVLAVAAALLACLAFGPEPLTTSGGDQCGDGDGSCRQPESVSPPGPTTQDPIWSADQMGLSGQDPVWSAPPSHDTGDAARGIVGKADPGR
jgi:hypothetical protein